jgi:glycosyltransferase involved in cell wall biosynthesis
LPEILNRRCAVIVACFDDGATLEETLASLQSQESHELVVVDDGSTDPPTLAAFERLRRAGVHVVTRPNGGLSAARMTGVAATSAPYVLPLDADDRLAPGALKRLADALDADPDASVAWGDVETFGDVELRVAGARQLDPWQLTYVNEIPVCALIRRERLLAAGGWQISGYEDWDLWLAFAERGYRGVYVPGTVLHYRRHGWRMAGGVLDEYGRKHAELRARHERLWADRRTNRRRSGAPRRARVLYPLIDVLPFVSAYDKHRLFRLVSRPHEVLPGRRRRLAASR